MASVISIGDCIIDAVEIGPGETERHPGGAALNLAVGLSRLGLRSGLVARVGTDPDGFRLRRYLKDEAVRLFETPTVDPTGVVNSHRANGEPTYSFASVMFRRRIAFTPATLAAVAEAEAVAVNTFPFDDSAQVASLVEAMRAAKGLTVVDANPRPSVIVDRIAFREGAEKLFSFADIAKISDEDADLLYREDAIDVVARLLSLGAGAVLFTHGEQGASIHTKQGLTVSVSIAEMPGPVLDTMGAGDASLATVIAYILRQGLPQSAEAWRFCLDEAMRVAAATCRQMGGGLALSPH